MDEPLFRASANVHCHGNQDQHDDDDNHHVVVVVVVVVVVSVDTSLMQGACGR